MLARIIIENGVKKIQPLTADVGAGAPVGSLAMMYKKSAPSGYLYCDGSTFNAATYPALYAYLGSNTLPDYREFAPVGAEQNTTDTIAAHDVYAQGESKDDCLQDHKHELYINNTKFPQAPNSTASSGNQMRGLSSTGSGSDIIIKNVIDARSGDVTRGKRKAVYFYIKATSGLAENQQDNVLATINENNSYSTTEQPTGAKWIDGKNIYKKTVVIDNGGAVLAEDGSYEKSLGVANVDTVISLTGISKAGNQYIVIAGTDATIAGVYTVRPAYDISSGKVIAHIKGYANITEIIVTVEYTKTTD